MVMSDKKEVKKVAHREVERPKICVGELCWNPKTGKLEFEFDRATCPRDVIKHLEAQTPMVIRAKLPKTEEKP